MQNEFSHLKSRFNQKANVVETSQAESKQSNERFVNQSIRYFRSMRQKSKRDYTVVDKLWILGQKGSKMSKRYIQHCVVSKSMLSCCYFTVVECNFSFCSYDCKYAHCWTL